MFKVDFVFSQAEVFLSWKSLLLNNFFKDLHFALFELKDLVEKVSTGDCDEDKSQVS